MTLPVEALQRAGIRTGDTLRAEVRGPGEVLLVRDIDPVAQFAGALTGVFEPDEIDGYSNDTKFGMTYQDQLNYNRFITQMAHSVGISIGLKGDIDQVKDLVNDFDWTLNEECSQYGECTLLKPFSNAGKAVLEVEYKGTLSSFCPTANTNNWNAMLMPLNLDGGRQPCR